MHPKNHPPLFVPAEYHAELERLTKAALMDIIWDLAATIIPEGTDDIPADGADDVIAEIRKRAAYIVTYREQQL